MDAVTWIEDVRDAIHRIEKTHFSLEDLYALEDDFSLRHPKNSHIRPKLRQTLQRLMALGELDRLSPGNYRMLALALPDERHLIALDDLPEEPHPTHKGSLPDAVPLEVRKKTEFYVNPTVARNAVSTENRLVQDYSQHLIAKGHITSRFRIPTNSSGALYTDLHDETDNVLYEGKSDASRVSVRLALGQLYDYKRYVLPSKCAVLTPARPSDDMCDLLIAHQMGIAFRHRDSFATENL